ncbi:cell division protein FtsZ [Geobacter argillaceus]|uniref:Cell division protein FtsZ n=1 Tax=Geobacter argillaceus TaxID=345631 RepID=A0A562VG94_9BACT|nr:cell division protein FtsZ [Geobacter argillaceus]
MLCRVSSGKLHLKKYAVIKVIGIGTAGGTILENIMQDQIDGIDYIAANTVPQVLNLSSAPTKILLKGGVGSVLSRL